MSGSDRSTRASRVKTALATLGTSKRSIVKNLNKLGLKGVRGDCRSCPVAKFLVNRFKKAVFVAVDNHTVEVEFLNVVVEINTPKVLGGFIDDFDSGKFPRLEILDSRE